MAFKDGVPVADCLLEAAGWHKTIKVACQCGHVVHFDPHALWWLFERKGWNGSFAQMQRRFFCSICFLQSKRRVRPSITALTMEEPTVKLPMPPEHEWRRARSRFR